MKPGDQDRGGHGGPEPDADLGAGEAKPQDRDDQEPEMADSIGQHPGLGIGLVEEPEVAEPPQAKLQVACRSLPQLADRPAEEDARPLGLGTDPRDSLSSRVSAMSSMYPAS